MQRYLSVDLLRGLSILLMVQVHFVGNLSPRDPSSPWLYDVSGWLGMLPAPFFTFLSGLSFCLWTHKQKAPGQPDAEISKIATRRGLFLFGTGIAFNVLVWLPEETFNWDILTLLGAAFILLAFARKLPPPVLVLLCVLCVLLSPPLRVMADYSSYWVEDNYEPDFTLDGILLGFLLNGYFPLLPWIAFPLAGYFVGDVVVHSTRRSWPARMAGFGAALIATATLLVLFGARLPAPISRHYATGITLYPASTGLVLGTLGLAFLSFAGLHVWLDGKSSLPIGGPLIRFLQRWSTFSLTIYIVHHVAHLWPLWIHGWWMGEEEPTAYWRHAMSAPLALGLSLVFVVVCDPALRWLERHRRYSFEAAMRWVCD